ncbi:MAG TPA: hypothetical protein DCQ06_11500, partial [Myxococcales bacterium]|nr:hypothetical protein [Myxococcales bacterium]
MSKQKTQSEKRELSELNERSNWLLRESRRLLRRHGNKVPPEARKKIDSLREQLEHVCEPKPKQRDLVAVRDACEELDRALSYSMARWRKSPTREYIEAVSWAVGLALLIRAFVFEAFKIPSGSMIPTLHVHDHLFVNKFIYGLKIPFTRIKFFDQRQPKHGEIIVFEYPYADDADSGKDLIKRVIAVAGDRVQLKNNQIWLNGKAISRKPASQLGDCGEHVQLVARCPDAADRWCFISENGVSAERFDTEQSASAALMRHNGFACQRNVECIAGQQWTSQHRAVLDSEQQGDIEGFINSANWPEPVFNPMTSTQQARRYYPSDNSQWPVVEIPKGHVLVMGDNRDNSKDGRFFGLVPLNTVKGKAGFIWYAY